ncbi:MAG: hypothetical protein E6Q27_09100 [Aeromicrobium sp.]|nr:MAG: hypothetical protein E6Q27_09100 [Aeromicrobium sp.]
MAHKQSVYGRMSQLSMASIDAILDHSDTPNADLDYLIDSFTAVIEQAEQRIDEKVSALRLTEADHASDVAAKVEWEHEHRRVRELARDAQRAGRTAQSQQFVALATYAAGKAVSFESWARQTAPHIAEQSAGVKHLQSVLAELRTRLEVLEARRLELARNATTAITVPAPTEVTNINVFDPTSELSRFRARVIEMQSTMD